MKTLIMSLLLCFICLNSFVVAQTNLENYTLTGTVLAKGEKFGGPLVGAYIIAYGYDSTVILGQGVSDASGKYSIVLPSLPTEVKISYVGYKTFTFRDFPLEGKHIYLGSISLTGENILEEATVTGALVKQSINTEEYNITNEMRAKATNTLELLDQVHGLRYDKMSNSIRVGNETKVLILVDNMEQSSDYTLNLNPSRISKVTVSRNPKGRYQSEGYEAVINIILKTQYTGYDITVQNFGIANLAKNNGNDWLMSAQPSTNLVYTNKKVNIYANYTYMTADWNMPITRNVRYEGLREMQSDIIPKRQPNDVYDYHANSLTGGINYKLNDKHKLSFQGTYLYENTSAQTRFDYSLIDLQDNKFYRQSTLVRNNTKQDNYTATLYYAGKIAEKLSIYSDFTYNHYTNGVGNALHENNAEILDSRYTDKRDFIRFNADFKYAMNDKFALNFGYATHYKKYDSKNLNREPILKYKEMIHRGFIYLSYNPSAKWGIELGSGMVYTNMGETNHAKAYWKLLPTIETNYTPTDFLNIRASYVTRLYSPSLNQLSPIYTAVDPLLSQHGNPDLKSSLRHTVSVDISLWDRLTITPRLRYAPQLTSEYYYKSGNSYRMTYQNMNLKEYALQMVYDQPLGKYFGLNASATYYYNKMKFNGLSNSTNGWQIDAEVNYFNPKQSLMVQLGYYRSMDKSVQLQGFQMLNFDSWMLSVNKGFFKDRVSIMLGYFLPLKWGVRSEQQRVINTDFYNESYNIGLRPYRNTLMMRISFRLSKGKTSYSRNRTTIDKEQRINRTFDF